MATADSSLRPERYRDLAGRDAGPWIRRAVMLGFLALVAAALANVFGQRTTSATVSAPAAQLEVSSPTRLRGGLLYQARFTVDARRRLGAPRLVLGEGWLDGLTLNTAEPAPAMELNRDGRVVLEYGSLAAGERLRVWLQYQVNPTARGTRDQTVELDDGRTPVANLTRSTTIFP